MPNANEIAAKCAEIGRLRGRLFEVVSRLPIGHVEIELNVDVNGGLDNIISALKSKLVEAEHLASRRSR